MFSLEKCVISEVNNTFYYNRYVHQHMLNLIDEFNNRYNGYSVPFPSGVCAIDSILNCLMLENEYNPIHLIYGNELYCDSPRCFKYTEKMYPNLLTLHKVDITNETQIKELFQKCANTSKDSRIIFYFETCSNPNGSIFNFELLKELKNIHSNLRVVVDNTWVSSVLFNPFKYEEVDVVLNSLTKYYGAGKSGILGMAISRTLEFKDILFVYAKNKGLHVSPIYCNSVLNEMKNMKKRLEKSSALTVNVIEKLVNNNIEVIHPALENHKSHNRAKTYFNGLYPSVFTFILHTKKEQALEKMKNAPIELSTSFGAPTSRFDSWPIGKKNKTICRFSVGYEDNLENILDTFSKLYDIKIE